MGNIQYHINNLSSTQKTKITEYLDYIASYYITDLTNKRRKELMNKSFCKELTNKIAIILKSTFENVNKETKIMFMNGFKKRIGQNINLIDNLDNYKNVAKYYVKIAHIYAFIQYLLNSAMFDFNNIVDNFIHIFEDLYYDCDFDLKKKQFLSVSNDNRYSNDLASLISGLEIENTKSHFNDITANMILDTNIKPKKQKTEEGCATCEGNEDILFIKYGAVLKLMLMQNKKVKNDLLDILDNIIIFVIDPKTHKKVSTINKLISFRDIEIIINKIKKIFDELINDYETNIFELVKLKQAIVEEIIFYSTVNQIDTLKELQNSLKIKLIESR